MPRISAEEAFERLPLRVHAFLADVPVHDVWFIDLPRWRAGIMLDEFLRTPSNSKLDACGCSESSSLFTQSLLVRILLHIRFFVGRFFGWDPEPPATTRKTFAARLTDTDHSRSLVMAGTRDGFFRVVYRFENEQLLELMNGTVHAAALTTLVETANAYRFYLGVYVRSVSRLTPIYMTLIGPFRTLMVYPSLLRGVRVRWNQAFGTG